MTIQSTSQASFTGRHMLAIMLSFFGVIVAVNFSMAWLAGKSWTGLVVKNSYVASQKFNATLAEARAQSERGWKSNLSYNDGVITFSLADRQGIPVTLDNLKITTGRPAFERLDRTASFVHVDAGTYELRRFLSPGVWSVRIQGGTGVRRYRRDDRIFVPNVGSKADD